MKKLTHLDNPEWIETRKKIWEKEHNICLPRHSYDKKTKDIYKKYFFKGDFLEFDRNLDYIEFDDAYDYYPGDSLEDIINIANVYWDNLHKNNDSHESKLFIDNKNHFFYSSMRGSYTGRVVYQSPRLMADVFFWAFGESYVSERKLDIGLDYWQPTFKIDSQEMIYSMLWLLMQFLFEIDRDKIYQQYDYLINYFLSIFPLFEYENYSLEFANLDIAGAAWQKRVMYQAVLRDFLLQLMGFDFDDTVHNRPDLEEKIRDKLFNEISMPDEFYELVEFLKREKLNARYVPEDED